MARFWLNNDLTDRLAMLEQATDAHTGMVQLAVEKDWWVMVTLKALFDCECSDSLIFKGGTSLSKGFGVIDRFSEDIDLAISHTFFGIEKTSKSQKEKLRKKAREYIHTRLSAELDDRLKAMGIEGYRIENVTHVEDRDGNLNAIDSDKDPTVILLHYPSIVESSISYIPPRVKIEVSCLSMDVPTEMREIRSMIAETFPDEDEGTLGVFRTVVPSRTFLEKIFLLAEEFQKARPRHVRMSRHLYDLERLMDTGYGKAALADDALYNAIIEHRRTYYALKYVDYDRHARETISFLPPDELLEDWRKDYADMQAYFIYGDALDFNALIERMRELQARINHTSRQINDVRV